MMNRCSSADGPQDSWPTQPVLPRTEPANSARHGAWHRWRRNGVLRWGAAVAAVVVLAGGGSAAALALRSGSSPASSGPEAAAAPGQAAGTGSAPPAGSPGQAAVLSAILNSASAQGGPPPGGITGPAASLLAASGRAHPGIGRGAWCARAVRWLTRHGHPLAARAVRRWCQHRPGLRSLRGIHGVFTIQTRNGPKTLAFERGVISSVGSGEVVIRAADGATFSWHLVSNTVVRQAGHRVPESRLAAGDQVFAGGPVVNGADDARLIAIRLGS
jgi:hypothetical protein